MKLKQLLQQVMLDRDCMLLCVGSTTLKFCTWTPIVVFMDMTLIILIMLALMILIKNILITRQRVQVYGNG
jgi:uncharacterized protein (DUF983 family)